MGISRGVEAKRSALDLLVDPGLVAPGASGEHLAERAVDGHLKAARADPAGERAGQVKPVERKDRAAAWLDPENVSGVAAVGHREDTGGIAAQEQSGVEPAHSGRWFRALLTTA